MIELRIIARNKKAQFDYFIEETFEAGIVLKGTEIKSIRKGSVNIKDAYVRISNNEAFIINMHIATYKEGNQFNHEETRERKLLLHKKEIVRLGTKLAQQNATLIPTKVYFVKGLCKIEVGFAKGKKKYDKRQDLKEKDMKRRVEKALHGRRDD